MGLSAAELAVARLSRQQHGTWSRKQALARGMSQKMIRTRVESGEWVGLDHAVYGHIAVPPSWERSLMAAVVAEPWAVVSHRAAAALHELVGFRRGRPEITVRPGANARGRLAIVHRGIDLRTTTVRRIPVVTVAQTFIDIAQVASEAKVRAALSDRADRDRRLLGATRDRFCALAPRGGRDLRRLRAVLERFGAGTVPTRSELESGLAGLLSAIPGLPEVVWETTFPGRCAGDQRVDALIPDYALVIEADGRAWHTRVEDFERDRRRDGEAAAAGYQTLRFTWHQVQHEASWVRRIVVSTGRQRAVEHGVGDLARPLRGSSAPNREAA